MFRQSLLLISLCLTTGLSAHADVLLLDTINAQGHVGPQTGVDMQAVTGAYGAPETRSAQVGEPPITRWYYPGFTVYFESDRVIHSVASRPTPPGSP